MGPNCSVTPSWVRFEQEEAEVAEMRELSELQASYESLSKYKKEEIGAVKFSRQFEVPIG